MQNIRNIAIIAHVDHGKTTLVDKMLLAGHLFRENQNAGELILDNNDLERERGITILSKNVSINYKGYKINIIDTPGHADFGGEVERVLNMADGCLLVDAFEGPMPQTRFVLQKAIEIGLKPVVVINKVDKPNCRPDEVQEMVFDLMFNLDATEEQLDFPTIYGSAKQGWMSTDWQNPTEDITAVLDAIIEHIPAPTTLEGPAQMLITSLDFSSYVGRIAVGRVHRGELREGSDVAIIKKDGTVERQRIKELHVFEGMGRKRVDSVKSGDICALVGIANFEIGDTVADINEPEALPRIAIDEPTMSMTFTINDSPFFGRDGKLRGLKRQIHEGGIRVPFIALWPGVIEAGSETDMPVAFYDVMPTLAELAGVNDVAGRYGNQNAETDYFDGISFAPTLEGKDQKNKHDFLYWEFDETDQIGVRRGDWKLIVKNGQPHLYDLATDIHEDNDIASEHPDIVSELTEIIFREHTPNPHFSVTLPEKAE